MCMYLLPLTDDLTFIIIIRYLHVHIMHNNLLTHNEMHINFVFRFDHSLINPTFTRLDKDNNPIGPLNLTELFFNPLQYFISGRTDPVLHGLLQDKSREVDEFVTRVLTTQFSTNSEDSLGLDFAAQNI